MVRGYNSVNLQNSTKISETGSGGNRGEGEVLVIASDSAAPGGLVQEEAK